MELLNIRLLLFFFPDNPADHGVLDMIFRGMGASSPAHEKRDSVRSMIYNNGRG